MCRHSKWISFITYGKPISASQSTGLDCRSRVSTVLLSIMSSHLMTSTGKECGFSS